MTDKKSASQSSLESATRWQSKFSSHGTSLGAAGKRILNYDPTNATTLSKPGQSVAVSPQEQCFNHITIGAAWDPVTKLRKGPLGSLLNLKKKTNIDLDIGCLYELQNGERGAIQAFGEKWGTIDKPPYIALSGDERTGDTEGFDEQLNIIGENWPHIKRALIYLYIYDTRETWAGINPRVLIDIPGEEDLAVTLSHHEQHLQLCAIGMIENIRGGLKLTNISEYYHGHEDMDRAFGFGLNWEDGEKS